MKTVLSKTNKLHLVALLFTLFSFSVCAQIPNTTLNELKVMTWNVWYGFSQLTASSGKLPADHPFIASQTEVQQKATSFLLTEAPDVLALQELNGFDANSLLPLLLHMAIIIRIFLIEIINSPQGLLQNIH